MSALNLRTVLAMFGLFSCALLAWWTVELGASALSGILAFLAFVALADLVVIQLRRRERVRQGRPPRSLFE